MKQVIIGDVHGYPSWKRVVEDNPDADRIIFIGDYLDSFHVLPVEQLFNLQEIVAYKKSNPTKVILLIGNHDHHYLPGVSGDGTSGYQHKMAVSFRQVFEENIDLFQMCFEDEYGIIYSHAGITRTFMKERREKYKDKIDEDLKTSEFINELFKHNPATFCYDWRDRGGYGDHIVQSCIWVRPNSLYRDKISNFQVVGHTPQTSGIDHISEGTRRGFHLVDALEAGEYLIRENEEFKIGKLTGNNINPIGFELN